MSVRNLEKLVYPSSVAVVGASTRPHSVGLTVMKNLLSGGFRGPVIPVNPKHKAVAGVLAYPDLASVPVSPDLVMIGTPPDVVPEILEQASAAGAGAAVVLTAGIVAGDSPDAPAFRQQIAERARAGGIRVLGPNCLGLLVASNSLNASFAHLPALPGRLAFLSQSGAMCTAVLDWAHAQGIGFSHFVSLGDSVDVDFGDLLDFLGGDPDVDAILMYIEDVKDAREFMSAARAAARNKPVLAIKAGRGEAGARAAASHTGALAGGDDVYSAAFKRAGMLRVNEIEDLFSAVETLARTRRIAGNRLAVMTNGGGPGVMAADALSESGGELAVFSDDTIHQLDACLPATWSRQNPADIIGDATPERYAQACRILLEDPGYDALLVMHVPVALASAEDVAQAVIDETRKTKRVVLTCWLGGTAAEPARRKLAQAGLPSFETPEAAIQSFLHLVEYEQNQNELIEIPRSVPEEFSPDDARARRCVDKALEGGRELLTELEAKDVLDAYGLPVIETELAHDPQEAARLAEKIGFPVALKIVSPDVTHKSDVGGVALNLGTPQGVERVAQTMADRVRDKLDGPNIEGFAVERMAQLSEGYELFIGVKTDAIFGPVVVFGHGGTAVELLGDRAIGLPPLNMRLAEQMVKSTRIYRLLKGYRDRPPIDLDALYLALVKVSQLIVDMAAITELDINPLYSGPDGVLALDARIVIHTTDETGPERLAIRPYPQDLEDWVALRSGKKVFVRPIRPEDEPAHQRFFHRLRPEDVYFRFFGLVREFEHSQMARFTQIDYDREMAFIAQVGTETETPETVGVVRAVSDPDNQAAEFGIVVQSDYQGQGLGSALLEKMIDYCRGRGLQAMVGQVLADNKAMLDLAEHLGFKRAQAPEPGVIEVRLPLR